MPIPLEDNFEDIIGKAMRGLQISESDLAARTGVDRDTLGRLCRGEFCDEAALRKIAPVLGLHPATLTIAASRAWQPRELAMDGLAQFNTPYRDMRVNAYLIWDPDTRDAAVFDTGTNADPLLASAGTQGLTVRHLFITHTHNDHVADLDRLRAALPGAPVRANRAESWPGAETFAEGATFSLGSLSIEARTTSGHSIGGTTYVVRGLRHPVAVVGDALFAGSMGGGMISYPDALRNNREKILTLPDDTIICPGHGPLSTVGEEKRHNPFYPEFKG